MIETKNRWQGLNGVLSALFPEKCDDTLMFYNYKVLMGVLERGYPQNQKNFTKNTSAEGESVNRRGLLQIDDCWSYSNHIKDSRILKQQKRKAEENG